MSMSLGKAEGAIKELLNAGLVANLLGSPGVGKSGMIRSIAEQANLELIDFRLAQADPTDLHGFPTLNTDHTRSHYAPPTTFPLSTDKVPSGRNGWLLFFDELNASPNAMQTAAYKIVLDREVGAHKLHPKVYMLCAGNLDSDKAIVNRLSTAMKSRLATLEVHVDPKEWLQWAWDNGIDKRITAYLEWKPKLVHNFNPDSSELTFPCPRTWEFASKLLSNWPKVNMSMLDVLQGVIGKAAAIELITFCEIYQSLPTLKQMEDNPDSVQIDQSQKDVLYAITSLMAERFNESNAVAFVSIMERLPLEFQVLTCQGILRKNESMKEVPALKAWIRSNASELY